jgi:hypothetical protein
VNVDEMQKKLSQKAAKEPEHQFENLYGMLCNEVWLRVAAHTTLKNAGSVTAVAYAVLADNVPGPPPSRLCRLIQPVMSPPHRFSTPHLTLLACI